MNRKHSRNDYISLINKIKNNTKYGILINFIVGYPGETDYDFQQTLDLINQIGFASSYSFKYSSRPGTPSSLKENNIEESILDLRLQKIQKLLADQQNHFNESFLDKEVEVLFTNFAKKANQYVGRTKYLQPVHVYSFKNIIGKKLKIKIEN